VGEPHSARIKTRGLWDHCVSPQTPGVCVCVPYIVSLCAECRL
jgi:hypothetical protein